MNFFEGNERQCHTRRHELMYLTAIRHRRSKTDINFRQTRAYTIQPSP